MEQIVVKVGELDAAPRTTEESIYPNIDDSFEVVSYAGDRLAVRENNVFGVKLFGNMQASLQGLAVYGDKLVRMANGTTHYIYKLTAGGLSQVASFTANTGHSNSLQFAPFKDDGQAFPYLYVANLAKKCSVLSISSDYDVSIVQTITIGIASVASNCNLQIGDDGYLWCFYLDSNNHHHFIKFRRVSVGEGDVTLSQSDVVDEWHSDESYPSSTYLWQGMTIRNGHIWLSIGQIGTSQARGIFVYSTTTHAKVTWLDLSIFNVEFEDIDFWDDSLLVATYGSQVYQMKF